MKKIFSYAMMLLAVSVAWTSCEDDNDSNPTLVTPTAFTVNNPEIGQASVDLSQSNSISLTWSQPVFTTDNAPVVANYEVQISPTGSFSKIFDESAEDNTGADFFALGETYTECKANIPASDVNRGLEMVAGWTSPEEVPANLTMTLRVRAFVQTATMNVRAEVVSNTVTINTVPQYIELKAADPELWWLIGGDICDGSWGSDYGKAVIPMQTVDGYDYDAKTGQGEITWTGYLAGNGFKLRGDMNDGWATQWGQGDAFGSYVKNDGGSGNITVPAAGYYTITLNTAKDVLKIEKADINPEVFNAIYINGSFNGWGDGVLMAPCFTFNGAINHDWYLTIDLAANVEIKFQTNSWAYETAGQIIVASNGDLYGNGVPGSGQPNIVIPEAGTYLVLYNDITRAYRFIKQ